MSQIQLIKQKQKDWRVLEFVAPISEKVENDIGEFLITGVAINETTTLNNVKYVSDELQKATESFRDVPILLDHKNEVKNIVGRTTENVVFNNILNRIEYEAKIMDKEIREMIKDGRIKNVSIGAKVNDLVEEEDGSMKAVGIHGLEISIVAVPGDGQASLGQAIKDNFHLKELYMSSATDGTDDELNGENKMAEEDEQKVEVPEEKEEAKEEVTEEKVNELTKINEQIAKATLDLRKKELALLQKKVAESEEAEAEPEKEEVKDETKGEVVDDTEEKSNDVGSNVLERVKTGYSLYKDYSKEGADTKLKRLVR